MSTIHQAVMDLPPLDKKYRRLLFYSRFVLLYQFAFYGEDGIAYGNLKDTQELGIPAGSLSPNLLWLKKQGYVVARPGEIEKDVYCITQDGKTAFAELKKWLTIVMDDKRIN